MNKHTLAVFHALMKNGWIDRTDDSVIWPYTQEIDVLEELELFKSELGFDLYTSSDRLYLIPTQDNDLFLKNNIDFRKDIKDTSAKAVDIYLLNYLAIFIIFLFFNGEGNDPLSREFISRENLINEFNNHCTAVENNDFEEENDIDYSENFRQLASVWLSKTDSEHDTKKLNTKNGVINKILIKFKAEALFEVGEDDLIRPTRKMKDLMPYFLRKDRVCEIQDWIEEEQVNAENK